MRSENLIHSSDGPESAQLEISIGFDRTSRCHEGMGHRVASALAQLISEKWELLNRLDRAIGDGDPTAGSRSMGPFVISLRDRTPPVLTCFGKWPSGCG